jgi:hypothetical protein
MASGPCSVLIIEWNQLEIQSWAPLQRCRTRDDLVFMRRERIYLHALLVYRKI